MRITANITADNALYNIQQQRARLDTLQGVISSGQNVSQPSDDPIASRLLLDMSDKLKAFDQFKSNITTAKSWIEFTNTALTSISNIITEARKVANENGTGNSDPTSRQNAHDLLVEMKNQMIDAGNTQYGDQYIFGGANNLVPPFIKPGKTGDLTAGATTITNINVTGLTAGMQVSANSAIPAGTLITAVTAGPPSSITLNNAATATVAGSALNFYAGDSTERVIEIATGTTQTISVTGNRLLMGTGTNPSYGSTNILDAFDALIAAVGDSTTASNVPAISAAAQQLDAGSKQVFSAVNINLSRSVRLDNMNTLIENNMNTLNMVVSKIQTVDMAKAGVDLNQQQTAFQASLSATAKITQLSLLDYL